MTVFQHQHAQPIPPIEQLLDVLEQMHPAYHFHISARGMWSAARAVAPTQAQADAGLAHYLIRPSGAALAAVLADQLAITQGLGD